MPFVQAKCPECGGMLAVDGSQKAAICDFCGKAFIIQEAINNYTTNNVTNHNYGGGAVVNVYENQKSVSALMERAFMFLEDADFLRANEYFEKVLDIDPECAQAYLGKLMAELRVRKQEALRDCAYPFDNKNNYQKAFRFADDNFKKVLVGYIEHINTRNENARLEGIYCRAKNIMNFASAEKDYKEASRLFKSIAEYKDATILAGECLEKAESKRKDTILFEAKRKMVGDKISNYETAIWLLESIPGWKDSNEKLSVCKKRIDEIKGKEKDAQRRAEKERLEQEHQAKLARQKAEVERLENERQAELARQKEEIARKKAEKKEKRNKIILRLLAVFLIILILVRYAMDSKIAFNKEDKIILKGDGTVVATGIYGSWGECDVTGWTEIIEISTDYDQAVGLKSDGTVVAAGRNGYGQCDVQDWTDIKAISTSWCHTVGLKSDGTVVVVGSNDYGQHDVDDWTDIVEIATRGSFIVGLKSDGTVVATGNNDYGNCDVKEWTEIVAISVGDSHTVGLKSDGTVVAVGKNYDGRCNVDDWTDIVAIFSGRFSTVGLKSDGTVVATGDYYTSQSDVSEWTDIVAISASDYDVVGLKSDGTVIGSKQYVKEWTDIVSIFNYYNCIVGLESDGTILYAAYDNGEYLNYECEKYKDDDVVSVLID